MKLSAIILAAVAGVAAAVEDSYDYVSVALSSFSSEE